MTDVAALLTVQEHDTALAQIAHRVATLPERQALADVERRLGALEGEEAGVRAQLADLQKRQRKLEDEAAGVAAKIDDVDKKLYSGTVTSPRELQALQSDLAALKKHKGDLDDGQLEVMIEREPVDEALAALDARRRELDGEGARLRVAIAEGEAAATSDAVEHRDARAAAAAEVPAELLALYDRVRQTAANGIAAARLTNGTCMACRLKLSAVDLDRIKREPRDALVRCEECGAILVR